METEKLKYRQLTLLYCYYNFDITFKFDERSNTGFVISKNFEQNRKQL